MCEQQVTAIDVVPTMLKALIEDERIKKCRSLRRVTSGGEVLSAELKDRVYRLLGEVELVNMYGPTEAAITTTYHRCDWERRANDSDRQAHSEYESLHTGPKPRARACGGYRRDIHRRQRIGVGLFESAAAHGREIHSRSVVRRGGRAPL